MALRRSSFAVAGLRLVPAAGYRSRTHDLVFECICTAVSHNSGDSRQPDANPFMRSVVQPLPFAAAPLLRTRRITPGRRSDASAAWARLQRGNYNSQGASGQPGQPSKPIGDSKAESTRAADDVRI